MDWKNSIKNFRQYLLLERSLAENSILSYSMDVEKLQSFAESIGMDSPTRLRTGDIQQFLVWLNELGMSTTSIARVLSGVKAFFTFLAIEGEIKANPAELIETPRLSRKLPDFLHLSEIEAIIETVDLSSPEGIRNTA